MIMNLGCTCIISRKRTTVSVFLVVKKLILTGVHLFAWFMAENVLDFSNNNCEMGGETGSVTVFSDN